MGVLRKLSRTAHRLGAYVYAALPTRGVRQPAFILGCGRSGTTILGEALSQHPEIAYLYEPRHLWLAAFPESDIWSKRAAARAGRLVLTRADACTRGAVKLSRLFEFERRIAHRKRLVEKLPINSFRVDLLHAVFPDAQYIYIHRSGVDVARSIAEQCKRGPWFGIGDYKWELLSAYARRRKETNSLPELCLSHYQRALLEWRLSTESVVGFLAGLPSDQFVETSYDELVRTPQPLLAKICNFLQVALSDDVASFAARKIHGNSQHRRTFLADDELLIGGPLLPLSIRGDLSVAKLAA